VSAGPSVQTPIPPKKRKPKQTKTKYLDSNKSNMVLVQKQIDRPMQQNREPQNKSTHFFSHLIFNKRHTKSKREFLQEMVLAKLGIHIQKNEIDRYIIFKVELRSKHKS
jgi:hypothetical protein